MSKKNDVKLQDQVNEPDWLEPNFNNIPNELKAQPWGIWKAEPRLDKDGNPTGKWNKAPISPITGVKVGANQPEKFGTFEEAMRVYKKGKHSGVGVLLTKSGITGIDIDNASELFEKRPEVKAWMKQALQDGAYCETSPSNTGVRLFVNGSLGGGGRKKDCLEIYDDGRFLTVTGNTLSGEGEK